MTDEDEGDFCTECGEERPECRCGLCDVCELPWEACVCDDELEDDEP